MAVSDDEKAAARLQRAALLAKISEDAERDQAITQKIINREIPPEELETNEGALFDDDDLLPDGDGDADDDDEDEGDQRDGGEGAGQSEGSGEDDDDEGMASASPFVSRSVDELNAMTDEDLAAYHFAAVGRNPTPGTKRKRMMSNIIEALNARATADAALKKE